MTWFLCLLFLFFTTSCENLSRPTVDPSSPPTFQGQAMKMSYKIIIGSKLEKRQTTEVNRLIAHTFDEVDRIFNKWNPASEVSKLNQLKAGIPIELSPLLTRLFNETKVVVELSQKRFDPTIETIQQLWKKKLSQGLSPTEEEIQIVASATGWDKLHLTGHTFYKDHDLTQLDFGGIAKGLAIDLLVERLSNEGFEDLYVEWGGEIKALGKHPENRPWTIYISRLHDTDPTHAIATLFLQNQAIATSGDYLQNWSVRLPMGEDRHKTVTYFHIFDPHTLHPLEATFTSIASASVLAPSCALADGLATSAMLFPSLSMAETWIHQLQTQFPSLTFWLTTRENIASPSQVEAVRTSE